MEEIKELLNRAKNELSGEPSEANAQEALLHIQEVIVRINRLDIRKEVLWFAGEMEKKLKENDHKGGWNNCDRWRLVGDIKSEMHELECAMEEYDDRKNELEEVTKSVITECADIANFAMMLADNTAALRQPDVMPQLPDGLEEGSNCDDNFKAGWIACWNKIKGN